MNSHDDDLNQLSIDQLEELLADTERLTHQLQEEIRLQKQREAIDNLPEPLSRIEEGKWANLKLLLEELIRERREKRHILGGE